MLDAVASRHRFGEKPILVFADHASNHVPAQLNNLGLPDDVLETHIAWDIGAGALALELANKLQATVLTCGFSRLIIDSNRDPSVGDSIPVSSDQIPIPGNQMLSSADSQLRVDQFFAPYHAQLNSLVDEVAQRSDAFIVSVHSFTKRMMGAAQDRPWDVGLLWREDEPSAQAMMAWLRDNSAWVVGDNQPYDARVYNYSVDRHIGPRGLRHLTFEVRQDHISTAEGVQQAADVLASAIQYVAGLSTQG